MNVVIFAAGRGSRLGASVPKFLVEVDGDPIFVHQLRALQPLGGQVYVVCGYRASILFPLMMEDLGSRHPDLRRNLSFIYNDDFKQSQIISIRRALDVVAPTRPTLFIDGDMLFRPEAAQALAAATETTVLLRETITSDGVIANVEADRLLGFERRREGQLEWGNLAFYTPASLTMMGRLADPQKLTYHYDVVNALVTAGVSVGYHIAPLAEVDEALDMPEAQRFVAKGASPPAIAPLSLSTMIPMQKVRT